MDDADIIITLSDLRAVKMCFSGTRTWAQTYGLSWADFVRDGIPASKLPKDGLSERVIQKARERRGL